MACCFRVFTACKLAWACNSRRKHFARNKSNGKKVFFSPCKQQLGRLKRFLGVLCAPLASFCTDRRSPLFGQVLLEGPHRLRLRRGRHHHHPLPEELPGRCRRHAVLVAEDEVEGIFSCFKHGFVSVGPLSTAATPQSRYILEPFVLLPELQRVPPSS